MVLTRNVGIWALVAAATMLLGCLQPKPPQKLDAPAKVKTAYVLTYPDRPDVAPVPDSVREALQADLAVRNLRPTPAEFDTIEAAFEKKRDTRERLEVLAELAGESPFVLLVETRVRFYSLLSGRYRWDVNCEVTIAPTRNLEEAQSNRFDLAAFLDYEHQDEADALRFVQRSLSERTGLVVDRFLRGREDVVVERGGGAEIEDLPEPDTAEPKEVPDRSSPPFEAGDAIYFVMLDRFWSGVPDNDQTTDADDPQAWHGGDIAGLTAKLDYLDRLGMTHVWVSPVWDARDAKFHGHGAFHGYWTEDLAAVEPRLGTEAELQRLAEAARERDMGLLLDMVLNHVGPGAPLVAERPDWFHGHGGITDWDDPLQITDYDVHGLPDLDQDNPEVYRHLLETSLAWQEKLDPAGFRLDAVKHISNDFWRRYNSAMLQAADGNFVLLGEVLDGNPRVTAQAMEEGGFNALFDFPLHFALIDVFCRARHPGRIGAILAADRLYPERVWEGERRGLVTLLDNHDLPRVVSVCRDDVAAVDEALEMMLSLRGTPSFTWGTEIPLAGASEPANRAMMDFDAEMALGGSIRKGLDLRSRHRVLVDGLDRVLHLSDDAIVLARVLPDSAAIVAYGRSEGARWRLPAWFTRGEFVVGGTEEGAITLDGVSVAVVRGDFSTLYGELREPNRRTVRVRVEGAAGEVRLVGSAPEVGAWTFEGGVEVEGGAASVALPVGEVVALKLATKVDGEERWEQRSDRFVLIEPGEEPIELDFGWEK